MDANESILKFRNDRIPKIRFGDEFKGWPAARQIEYLKKLSSSMNHAADVMQKERNAALEEIVNVRAQLSNAERALEIQKGIVMNNLTSSNAEKQSYIKKMQKLQAHIRANEQTIEDLRR